jgi:hypothetical protein
MTASTESGRVSPSVSVILVVFFISSATSDLRLVVAVGFGKDELATNAGSTKTAELRIITARTITFTMRTGLCITLPV